MAYLNFSDVAAAGAIRPIMANQPAAAALGPREWQVVDLARRDGMTSLAPDARLGRLRALLFGTRSDSRLADPRLEALRRVAVHAWQHGLAVPAREVEAFLRAGFDSRQLEIVVTRIETMRNRARG